MKMHKTERQNNLCEQKTFSVKLYSFGIWKSWWCSV